MERKTFLAIVLSFLFLISYNALVVAPQQKNKEAKIPQTFKSKSLIDNSNGQSKFANSEVEDRTENDQQIQIGLFKIRFSSDTGTIKEIYSENYHYAPILTNFVNISPTPTFKSFTTTPDSINFIYEASGTKIQKQIKAIDKNRLNFHIEFPNLSNLKNVQFIIFAIDAHRIKNDKDAIRDTMLFEYSMFIDNKVIRKNNAFKFSEKDRKTEQKTAEWFGWRDRYYFTIVKPESKVSGFEVNPIDDHRVDVEANFLNSQINQGAPQIFDFSLYVGPQDLQLLKNLDGNLNKIMAFSGFAPLDMIEKFIYNVLLFMNKYIHNWGVCIILVSLLIYGATYPLTLKSMMSMRKMQEVQPKMAELREKYKKDPQKLNTEVVQLYRIHNINPLGGCLPMLLQTPVFISLYQVLWRTHNFEGANFLWIADLSKPDKLIVFHSNFPFIGNELNILPVFMMIVMFFQQKLSSKNMVITDPSQEMQQKMMMFVFPVFIGGIFYHFASGLTLYFTIFYLLSTLTQYKMSKLNQLKNDGKR